METTTQTIKVQGYEFEGDPEILKYIQALNWDELKQIFDMVKWASASKIYDSKLGHLIITLSPEGGYKYVIAKAS